MNVNVSYSVDTGCKLYPTATATYIGTNIARFWHDPFLKKAIDDAVVLAGLDKDIFDYCNFLFSQVDNAIRRRYGGRELQLESVTVIGENEKTTVISFQ
jgi:hypothetical protein